jgi:glycosyltransferase involved in cell wall biosynthesis
MIGRTLEHAKLVMTVSQASKRDLLSFFEVAEENILVIPNGVDPAMFKHLPVDEIDGVRSRFQLTGRTALFVGNIKPHKNVERLIAAFAKVREDSSFSDLTLVIVGDEISKYPSLRRAVDRHEIRSQVRFLGFVPEATLVSLYRAADVFVFPSLYEGFGLPPLEAMANGTPVVTSKLSSLPEVVGEAAVTVDPYNVEEIAEAIKSTLVDPELRARLIESGQKQAQRFSWETAATEIHAVYMRALGLGPETSS